MVIENKSKLKKSKRSAFIVWFKDTLFQTLQDLKQFDQLKKSSKYVKTN